MRCDFVERRAVNSDARLQGPHFHLSFPFLSFPFLFYFGDHVDRCGGMKRVRVSWWTCYRPVWLQRTKVCRKVEERCKLLPGFSHRIIPWIKARQREVARLRGCEVARGGIYSSGVGADKSSHARTFSELQPFFSR